MLSFRQNAVKNNLSSAKRIVSAIQKTGRLMVPISLTLFLGCSQIPSDAKLKELFYANRDGFNRLVEMSDQDAQVLRIDFDFTDSDPQNNWRLSLEEMARIPCALPKAGLIRWP